MDLFLWNADLLHMATRTKRKMIFARTVLLAVFWRLEYFCLSAPCEKCWYRRLALSQNSCKRAWQRKMSMWGPCFGQILICAVETQCRSVRPCECKRKVARPIRFTTARMWTLSTGIFSSALLLRRKRMCTAYSDFGVRETEDPSSLRNLSPALILVQCRTRPDL